MRNFAAIAVFAAFTAACSGPMDHLGNVNSCDVIRNADGQIEKAVIISPRGRPLQYVENPGSTVSGFWDGAAYDSTTRRRLEGFFTVDTHRGECIIITSHSMITGTIKERTASLTPDTP